MYRFIVFDIDGTLIDSKYSICKGVQNLVKKERGKEYSLKELEFAFGNTGPYTLKKVGLDESYLGQLVEEILALADTIKPFEGIFQLLDLISEKGIPMGIVSSKYRAELEDSLGVHGLLSYFPYIVCADDVSNLKPHPEPMEKVCQMAGAAMDEVLFIGDSVFDVECAKASKVDFILAGWGANEELKKEDLRCAKQPTDVIQYL